jgi:outer membrane autotransporter protein
VVVPPPVDTTFRVEVPLFAALQGVLRRGDLAMLGTYHQRMGDENGAAGLASNRIWGRVIGDSGRFRQRGDAAPTSDGRLYGFQLGVDLFRSESASGHHDVGIYGGYTDGQFNVSGFASGIQSRYVGRLDPHATYAGVYWTYLANSGFYVDSVVQRSWYGGKARAVSGNRASIDGTGILASVETGYALPLSSTWVLEPQAQIIAQGSSIDDVTIPNAVVSQRNDGQLTGRIGLRTRARYETSAGSVQPYFRANLWKSFASTDRTLFATAAATTVIRTPNSALWGEAGAGLTWSLSPRIALYGEADHRFSLDKGQGITGHATSASVGLKIGL